MLVLLTVTTYHHNPHPRELGKTVQRDELTVPVYRLAVGHEGPIRTSANANLWVSIRFGWVSLVHSRRPSRTGLLSGKKQQQYATYVHTDQRRSHTVGT